MRKQSNNESLAPARVKQRGRAVLTGYGLDDDGGHVRYTHVDGMKLYGGSERVHGEICRLARSIRDEADRLGISLDSMTYEQYLVMREVVDRVNCEIPSL